MSRSLTLDSTEFAVIEPQAVVVQRELIEKIAALTEQLAKLNNAILRMEKY